MDPGEAKRAAESHRYRLQVRLGMVVRAARAEGNQAAVDEAERLKVDLVAIEIADTEWIEPAGARAIAALEPRVRALQDATGIEEHGPPSLPRWVRYLSITIPIVFVILVLAILIARRRRSREIDDKALAALEAAGEDREPSAVKRP